MKLFFRDLKSDDIPAILEISKEIWEGEDYIPHVIGKWMNSKDCLNYGAFLDEEKQNLIGFGRVRIYPNGLAWLEGGRVSLSHQRRGIGRALMKYAVEYAKNWGAKIAQFDTSTENLGSISLGNFFGFERKKSMCLMQANSKNLVLKSYENRKYQEIPFTKAREIYNGMDIGPGDEICVGWQFKPLKYLKESDGIWVTNSGAILHAITRKNSNLSEIPPENNNMWIIVYGKSIFVKDLVVSFLYNILKTDRYNSFDVFCSPETTNLLEDIGFSCHKGELMGVVLFEKQFKD